MLILFLYSLLAHAEPPSPASALKLFHADPAVKAALAREKKDGYQADGDASAALVWGAFGDEGYCSTFVATQPLAAGKNPSEKQVRLVAARVSLCWPENSVRLLDTGALGEAVRRLR